MQPQMASLCGVQGEASELTPCDCARFAVNRAWVGLLALEAGRSVQGPHPSILLDEAERIFLEEEARDEGSCAYPESLPNVRLNRALAELPAGDPDKAGDHLDRAGIDPEAHPRLALWQLEVKARIRLADKQPRRALDLYKELARRAEDSFSPEAAWRAAFGRANALELLGQGGRAIEACNEAERLLDQESLLVPLDASRDFIVQRQKAARFCLDLLLRANRKEEAVAAARRSAARALSNLRVGARIADLAPNARDQWEQAVNTYRDKRNQIEKLAAQIWKGLPLDQEQRLLQSLGHLDADRRRAAESAPGAQEKPPGV